MRVRFLHVRQRTVERADGDGGFVPVASLDVGDATYLPCDEAAVHETRRRRRAARRLEAATASATSSVAGGSETEVLRDADGAVVGRLVRRWEPLDRAPVGRRSSRCPARTACAGCGMRLDNRTPWAASTLGPGPARPDALRRALVAAHLVVGVERGRFLSQLDPPEWARGYVDGCENVGAFPVLAGPPGSHRPRCWPRRSSCTTTREVAPESEVAFCDATEMDEMLTLRAMTLTEEEKRQARGSDPARPASSSTSTTCRRS